MRRRSTLALLATFSGLACAQTGTNSNEMALSASRDTLGRQYADWRATQIDLAHRSSEGTSIYGSAIETERYSLTDHAVLAGTGFALSPQWSMTFEGNTSPSHKVLAKWSALAQLQRNLGDGWDVQAGVRQTEYSAASTVLTMLTAERYWNSYRAALTGYLGHLAGEGNSPAASLQVDYFYSDQSRVGLLLSGGRETENQPGTGVRVSDTREAAVIGQHWLNSRWAISYVALVHRQGDFYTRHELQLGLRRRF